MKVTLLHIGLIACLAMPAAVSASQDTDEAALDALDAGLPKPPVIKQEPAGAAELRDAVRRIAQRPTDSFALTDAGYAAIKLGDYDAAFNFFTKASAIQPADARIKAGLGIAQVRRENPFEALGYFDDAVRLGASERSFALDRAMAFDLLGNFERAERDYALAASAGSSDELTLRHAISLALSGRKDDADRMLIPMLQRENPEAWRARALMLAARGDTKEASKIAAGFLPERDARRMDGYFRNMARLTVAQQAAAMHFGHFPVGSNIGEDSEPVRSLALATGAKPLPKSSDSRLIPTGEALGAKTGTAKVDKPVKIAASGKKAKGTGVGTAANGNMATASAQNAVDAASRAKVTTVSTAQMPIPEAARPPVRIALPALASRNIPTSELPAVGPSVLSKVVGADGVTKADIADLPERQKEALSKMIAETAVVEANAVKVSGDSGNTSANAAAVDTQASQTVELVAAAAVVSDIKPIGPGFDSVAEARVIPETGQSGIVAVDAAVLENPASDEPKPAVVITEKNFDLGALVGSIEIPDDEKRPSVAPVDLKKIKTAAPLPKAETVAAKTDAAAKAAKQPVSGPRIFVQIATGADTAGLSYDYRRMAKKSAALFSGHGGWTSPWGKTRRLLVGPFADQKSAKKWEADFRKAGGDGFVWQSDKNAEVEKLKGK